MTETEPKLRQRTVGRLDRTRDPAILNAALDVLTENGYDATNMNDIAARAGVGKAAIYRRWASKAALITDTLVYWRPDLLLTNDTPDTGTLAGDLDALVEHVGRNENDLINNDLVLRVALEATRDPGLASALDDLMLFRGKRVLSTILAHAAARGEISGDRDWSLVADVVLAMGLLQVVGGQTVNAGFVQQVIDTLVLPAVHAPPTSRTAAKAELHRPDRHKTTTPVRDCSCRTEVVATTTDVVAVQLIGENWCPAAGNG